MKFSILFAILCFAAIGLCSQPKDSPAKNETHAAQSTPTPTPSNSDHKPADHTETAKDGPPHWYTSSEWWLVLIAALTGAAIAYQAREMARTTFVMEGQLKEMQDAGKQADRQSKVLERSVAAAEKSAEAAKLSADIAARVSIPRLVIEKFEPADAGAANLAAMLQYPNVKIVIKNYGQTPALLKFWNIVFTCEELTAEPDYWNEHGSSIILERDVIEPNQPYTIPPIPSWKRAELSPEDVEAIINHKKKLWAYGFICYDDIFRSARWRMKFCELALNVREGWIQWESSFSPLVYQGTEEFPWGLARGGGQKAENPNGAEQPN
jgi:hypothetical protein